MLTLEFCRERQKRLLGHMQENGLALVVLGNPKTIYYFTGALPDALRHHVFALDASGHGLLITDTAPAQCAADRVEVYTGYTLERVFSRATMHREIVASLRSFAAARPGPAAAEIEFVSAGAAAALGRPVVNLTPVLDRMRRRKDPDEIECLRRAIEVTEAGYAAVRRALAPGMTECEVYCLFHDGMVEAAGTSVSLRGDFACGTRAIDGGGPPTTRAIAPGDLCILDIFPSLEGYNCDLTRTFAAGQASDLQQEAWAHVAGAHDLARRLIRPGVPASAVYQEILNHLEQFKPAKGSFTHHAGHGVGLDAWEFPWLTPGSDQTIEEGDIIACEPGLYGEALRGGIRLEHNYLVEADGITALDTFPLEL